MNFDPQFWVGFGPLVLFTAYFVIALLIFPFFYSRMPRLPDLIDNRHSSKILGTWIRYWWMWVMGPLFKILLKSGLTPNQISTLGLFMAILSALTFAFGSIWLGTSTFGVAGWLMVFGGSMDFMDGWVARKTGQTSESGAFFDSCLDRIAESAVFAGLAWYFRDTWVLWTVMAAFTGSMMTSYSKCRGDKMGIDYGGGIMQRPERVVYLGVGAIFTPVLGVLVQSFWGSHFTSLKTATDFVYTLPLSFVALMSCYTTWDRIKNIMRLLDERSAKSR